MDQPRPHRWAGLCATRHRRARLEARATRRRGPALRGPAGIGFRRPRARRDPGAARARLRPPCGHALAPGSRRSRFGRRRVRRFRLEHIRLGCHRIRRLRPRCSRLGRHWIRRFRLEHVRLGRRRIRHLRPRRSRLERLRHRPAADDGGALGPRAGRRRECASRNTCGRTPRSSFRRERAGGRGESPCPPFTGAGSQRPPARRAGRGGATRPFSRGRRAVARPERTRDPRAGGHR